MSIETGRDPRVTLMREKYFTMRPKPLERWVWQQHLPASAERVFWFHWDLGAHNGTWCSQIPLRVVASECCVDPATVTRAYQQLKRLGLIRREDPGRDPRNPFQQATAVTEVRVPRELVVTLGRAPNRRQGTSNPPEREPEPARPDSCAASMATQPGAAAPALDRQASRAVFAKLSAGERSRFSQASTHRRATLEFDADSRLGPTDRAHVLATLESLARARPATAPPATTQPMTAPRGPRRLGAVDVIRIQRGLGTLASARADRPIPGVLSEVVFAVEEGALAKFPIPLAVNIALKKIREGAWSSPSRMPPDWSMRRALPETCVAAGGI